MCSFYWNYVVSYIFIDYILALFKKGKNLKKYNITY